jgi:CheY-like chemotaxis protein
MDTAQTHLLCGPSALCASETIQQAGRMPRLLYVDHDARWLVGFTVLLTMSRYVVFSTQSPAEALGLAKTMALNLALLDYELPARSGADLARQIRGANPLLPIGMFYDSQTVPQEVAKVADHYMRKDEEMRCMLQAVRRWTNRLYQVA